MLLRLLSMRFPKGLAPALAVIPMLDRMNKEAIRIEPENGAQQLTYILENLAKLQMGTSTHFHFFLQEDIDLGMEGNDILLMTAIMTEEMQEHIGALEAQGNSVEVLMLEGGEG